MRVPFLDLTIQYKLLQKELDASFANVFSKGQFIKGPSLDKFEYEFAKYLGVKYCIGVASGTDALYLSLLALGVGKGDEVILPANTFIASAYAVLYTGAKPVFVDVSSETYNIDVHLIEKVITRKTKAIMPVHLFGQPVEMAAIRKIAQKHNLCVIEDACQSHGATYKNKHTGSLGNIAAFSFYPGKNLGAYGDAGAITTNSKKLAQEVKKLREYGGLSKYKYDKIGFNSRLDTLQTAVLLAKLQHLDEWNNKRYEIALYYTTRLTKEMPFIVTPYVHEDAVSVFHLYVIQAPKRKTLMKYLETRGIKTMIHYPIPLHLQKSLQFLGYKKGDFPVTENLSRRIVSLPMFPELTRKQQDYVIDTMKEFYS